MLAHNASYNANTAGATKVQNNTQFNLNKITTKGQMKNSPLLLKNFARTKASVQLISSSNIALLILYSVIFGTGPKKYNCSRPQPLVHQQTEAEAMQPPVRQLFKHLVYMGKDYPVASGGYSKFINMVKHSFRTTPVASDSDLKAALDRGNYIIKGTF